MATRREEVRKWEIGRGMHESDILGASALEAAWDVAADFEAAEALNENIVGVFLDCSKCYERIPHARLQEEVSRTGFPQRLANLAIGMYAGERYIRVGEAVAQPVKGSSGILPGCGLAVALLK